MAEQSYVRLAAMTTYACEEIRVKALKFLKITQLEKAPFYIHCMEVECTG